MSRTIPPRASADDSLDIVPPDHERLPYQYKWSPSTGLFVYFTLLPSFLFALASISFFSDSESLPFLTI
jgi:hypothetical protein